MLLECGPDDNTDYALGEEVGMLKILSDEENEDEEKDNGMKSAWR